MFAYLAEAFVCEVVIFKTVLILTYLFGAVYSGR